MALDAFSSLESGVDTGFIQPYLFFAVAGITDFISFFLQNQFRHETVPQVALLTFLFFHGEMNIFHSQVFFREFLMTAETILTDKPLPSRRRASQRPFLRCLRAGIQKDPEGNEKYSS